MTHHPIRGLHRESTAALAAFGHRWLLLTAILCASATNAFAQSYGPPKILIDGQLFTFYGTYTDYGTNVSSDYYNDQSGNGSATIDESHNLMTGSVTEVIYDQSIARFSHLSGAPAPTILALDWSDNFLDLHSGPVVYSSSTSPLWDGSNWRAADGVMMLSNAESTFYVSKYSGVADGALYMASAGSPWYQYHAGSPLYAQDGWPASDVLALPPPQVYFYIQATGHWSSLIPVEQTNNSSGLSYEDSITYRQSQMMQGPSVTIVRHITTAGTLDGSISFSIPDGPSANASFNPLTWVVSGGLPGYAFAFSAPAGYPVSGRPTYVSWKGTLVPFQFSDSSGTDYYNFFSFEAQSLGSIAIDGQGNVTPSSTLPGGAGIFHPNGDITGPDNVIGLDMNGNPLGSPGVVAFFGAPDGSGQSIMLEDGSARGPTFQFPRPDGSFGVKYSGLAEGQYFIMANASGSYHSSDASPIYQFHGPNQGGGDLSIGAVATGWTLSNILPPQLYVNGLGVQLTAPAQDWWNPADQDPNGNPSRGGSAYYYGYGTGGSGDVSVSWNWSQAFSGISYTARTWGYPGGRFSSCGGIWSGGTEFINQSGTAVVSLTPPPVPWSTRFGPSSIQWNSRVLTFDRDASTMSPLNPRGADVYLDAAGYRIEIAPDHHVTVYYPNETTARYSGSYLPSQLQFDFGSQHFGTVLALDPNGDPIGTSSSGNISFAGDLDVQGNHFTLGTWTDSAGNSVNGLGLSYRDAIGSSPPQIRFDAMREITEWLWTRANPVAGAAPVKTMTLDSDNRLQLYPPTGVSTAKIVLDPGGVSEFKGVLRVYEHGDISMGEFKNPPMAP